MSIRRRRYFSVAALVAPFVPTNNLAIDGTGHSTTLAVTLTTSVANCILYASVIYNGGGPVTGVTDTNSLTWTRRGPSGGAGDGTNNVELWYAKATGTYTGTVTFAMTGVPGFKETASFGVSGSLFATPFDANAAIPSTAAAGTASFTTSNAADMLLAVSRNSGASAAASGWTLMRGDYSFMNVQYKLVTATQSASTVVDPNGNGIIGDAVVSS